MIVETTDAAGTLHSSYVVASGLDNRSVIGSLVVAIHQSPLTVRAKQPVEERTDEYDDADDAASEPADADVDIKAQIFVDCRPVGTVNLANSLKNMIQLSSSGALRAVFTLSTSLSRFFTDAASKSAALF